MDKSAIVIGSGAGGMATAIRLSSLGLQVTVIEKNPVAGGKIGQIREKGIDLIQVHRCLPCHIWLTT